jgi:hypothetical protein
VYQYEHWDHEGWSDGCLSRIDARTNDAGGTSRVQGELSGATFALRSDGASSALPRCCVHAYAYWNLQLLRQEHLLNPQTGTFDPVHLEELGVEAVELSGRPRDRSAGAPTDPDVQDSRIRLFESSSR